MQRQGSRGRQTMWTGIALLLLRGQDLARLVDSLEDLGGADPRTTGQCMTRRGVQRAAWLSIAVVVVGLLAGCSAAVKEHATTSASPLAPRSSNSPARVSAPAVSSPTAQAGRAEVVQACQLLAGASKSLVGAYRSPWVLAVGQANQLTSRAAQSDRSWQTVATDVEILDEAQPPGAALPPVPVTTAMIASYWAKYTPLVANCAVAGVTLPAASTFEAQSMSSTASK